MELRILEPSNLGRAMELAQRIEEKIALAKSQRFSGGFSGHRVLGASRPTSHGAEGIRTTGSSGTSARLANEVQRLSESEAQRKREKGLCYRCDEKWSPGHGCKWRELSILLTMDESDSVGEEVEPTEEAKKELEAAEMNQMIDVSLNFVAGFTSSKIMKFKCVVGDQEVVTLIDPGAIHNFILKELVQRL